MTVVIGIELKYTKILKLAVMAWKEMTLVELKEKDVMAMNVRVMYFTARSTKLGQGNCADADRLFHATVFANDRKDSLEWDF